MNNRKRYPLISGVLCLLLFAFLAIGCGSDEGEACGDGEQNNEETGIDCGGPVCDPCPTCSDEVQNGDEEGVDCGGSNCEACPSCVDGIQNGNETGVDCGGDCPICLSGVEGIWFSEGSDLSLILSNIEDVDSALLDFEPGGIYSIVYYKENGVLENRQGTYTQTASGVVDIWYVNVNQLAPTVESYSGIILNPSDNKDELFYELILLDGENSPPNAEAGLGSSNEGELGNSNISLFQRR